MVKMILTLPSLRFLPTIYSPANPVVQVHDAQSRPGKFDCFHDIQLAKQANLSKPWEAGYGNVMTAWAEICREVNRFPGFKINKKPEGLLIKTHCDGEVASMRKSGTSENTPTEIFCCGQQGPHELQQSQLHTQNGKLVDRKLKLGVDVGSIHTPVEVVIVVD
ncbi:hypothetical protein DYB31_007740 [Aphanomyces astaci]|uniref:Uncharacterized protein n=1 Tax=Aphanomyces astaci TaxID=112090 RepID=A0A397ESG2_APHAT|nr:hypothetical protein DYB31_007740 [Aphanomyces astaci]